MQATSLATMDATALELAVTKMMRGQHADADATSNIGDRHSPPPPPQPYTCKKRKPVTYYQRKSEITALQQQIDALTTQLAQKQATPTIQNGACGDAQQLRALYARAVERNALLVAGAQSLLSSFAPVDAAVPLKTHRIHLHVDPVERNRLLGSLHASKTRSALRFMVERTRFLDLRLGQRQGETSDLPDGGAVSWGFDVTPFADGHSLRQVYEELQYFINSEEMSISEALGLLTVRESDDNDLPTHDYTVSETRFLSTLADDLQVESNAVSFMACEAGYAINMTEFVDQDELYPYRPERYGRRDIVGVCMLTEIPTSNGHVVAMCRWSHVRFQQPRGRAPGKKMPRGDSVRDAISALCTFMPNVMAERLALREPEK